MSLARAVAWNTLVQVVGRAAGLAASIAFTAIVIHHLGLADYGRLTAASAYVALFTVLGESGLYLVSVRRASQAGADRPRILGTALGLRLLWSVPPLLAGVLLVDVLGTGRFGGDTPLLRTVVLLLSVNAYFVLLNQFLVGIFRMHLRMDLAVLGELGSRLIALAGVLGIARVGGGLEAVVAVVTLGTAANFVYAWIVARRFEAMRPRLERALARSLLAEAIVLAGVIILGLLRHKIDTLLLYAMRPPDEVGIYGAAYRVQDVLVTFPGLFVALLFPMFSRLVTEDRPALQRMFQRTFDLLLLAALGAALLVILLAPWMAHVLGAPQAALPMRVLALALPGVFVAMAFTHVLFAAGRQRWVVQLYAIMVVVNVAANLVAIPRWSYVGAAAVTVGTEVLTAAALAVLGLAGVRLRLQVRSLGAIPWALLVGVVLHVLVGRRLQPEEASVARALAVGVGGGAGIAVVYGAGLLALRLLPMAVLRSLLQRRAPGPGGVA